MEIHLVVKNNEQTIEKTLQSILPFNARLLVADIGCQDKTIKICKKYGAEVVRCYLDGDYSRLRNKLLANAKENWLMTIEPWETILRGHNQVLEKIKSNPTSYRFPVLQGDIITKQTRLWHKSLGLKFTNPVYEIVLNDAQDLPVYLHSVGGHNPNENLELVKEWRERSPFTCEPLYYHACTLLVQKKWKEFLNVANHYIFIEKKQKMSLTMTRYYCAMVQCYLFKEYQAAITYLLPSLVEKPTMAEFWCLLGDIYYASKQYEKASHFYENAMILGSRRLKIDDWPFEVSKYKEYPEKMVKASSVILEASKYYGGSR